MIARETHRSGPPRGTDGILQSRQLNALCSEDIRGADVWAFLDESWINAHNVPDYQTTCTEIHVLQSAHEVLKQLRPGGAREG